jgi:hypothetical protein
MKFVHKATGVEVKRGDEVKGKATPILYVSGWQQPTSPAGAGRIHVVRDSGLTDEQRMTQGMSFYPDVFGCEWVDRDGKEAIAECLALCDKGFETHDRSLYGDIDKLLSQCEQTERVVRARKLCEAGPTLSSPRFAYPHIQSALRKEA